MFDKRLCAAGECFGEAAAVEGDRWWCPGHLKQLREWDNFVSLGTLDWMRQFWLPLTEPLEEGEDGWCTY